MVANILNKTSSLASLSLLTLQTRARAGETFAVALLEETLANANAATALNALAWTDWPAAKRAAIDADRRISTAQGVAALTGIPVSIKDLYQVTGTQMHAGTKATLPDLGVSEAAAVARLRAAGAIIFGKTNMHEIALGATGENEWTGDVKNPHNPAHQAGGSSSGAGVAVARHIGHIGLGSDTGGSVRIPANFCGVVGFKPSFGAIPLSGALHLSWTCDHAGPLTRSVADARIAFEVMSQRRCDHSVVARRPRLAVPAQWLRPRLSDQVRQVFEQNLGRLRSAGAQIVDVNPSQLALALDCYTVIVRSEAAYVHRAALASGGHGFSASVMAPIRAGQTISAGQYFEAMRQRDLVKQELNAITRDYDAIVLPSAAVAPPLRGQTEVKVANGMLSVREAVLGQTLPFNLAQMPALSIPMAGADTSQSTVQAAASAALLPAALPLGLQIVGLQHADARLLALGEWIEQIIAAPSE